MRPTCVLDLAPPWGPAVSRSAPGRPGRWPATPASSRPSWARPVNRWTWAGGSASSTGRSAAPWSWAMAAAPSPAATGHRAGAPVTTSRGWWARNGHTKLDNGVLLCGHHHRLIHQGHWAVRTGRDRRPEFIPPVWIDPTQTPQHNRRNPPGAESVGSVLPQRRSHHGTPRPDRRRRGGRGGDSGTRHPAGVGRGSASGGCLVT